MSTYNAITDVIYKYTALKRICFVHRFISTLDDVMTYPCAKDAAREVEYIGVGRRGPNNHQANSTSHQRLHLAEH